MFSAFLLEYLGHKGLSIAAFISGLGDAHAATASIASLVAAGQLNSAHHSWHAMPCIFDLIHQSEQLRFGAGARNPGHFYNQSERSERFHIAMAGTSRH
ncbi:DUF4010 domain-containing protein [Pseudomonas plecoglossicida]|uniref:DUF4010 domain-containing protein n=1 Tax=Pseudomonas plecoglossicida TaxID=70775 RepID=UPI0021593460|nr:DUF4010 domain-containing protein [Pseudomonas plecoglossicida]